MLFHFSSVVLLQSRILVFLVPMVIFLAIPIDRYEVDLIEIFYHPWSAWVPGLLGLGIGKMELIE